MNLKQLIKQNIVWQGLYFVSLFVINVLLSRFLQAEEAGVVFYMTTILGFILVIANFGLNSSLTYYSANNTIKTEKLLVLSIICTTIICLILYFAVPFLWQLFPIPLIATIEKNRLALYYVVGLVLTSHQVSLFYSKDNFYLPNLIMIILNVVLLLLFYINTKNNGNNELLIHDYFIFHLLQGLLLTLAFVIKYIKFEDLKLPTITDTKQILKFASVSLLANVIFYVVYKLDVIFVQKWCTDAVDLGNYTQANKLCQMLLIIPQIIASNIFPASAANNNKKEIIFFIKKYSKIFAIATFLLILLLLIAGKFLTTLIFGATFYKTHLVIILLLPGIFCLMVSTLLSAYLTGKKQHKINVQAAVVAVITMLLLTMLSKSFYSIFIAATISSIAYFTEAMYCFIKFCKLEKLWVYHTKSS